MQANAFNFLTDEQARLFIREELEKLFKELLPTLNQGSPQCQVVDINGLLKARPFIGTKNTIYSKVRTNQIPHSKPDKKLYFDLIEIDKWLLSYKVKTAEELEKEANDYLNKRRR